MSGKNTHNPKIMSNDDPLDINELASLNDDISPEFIEQLQNQIEKSANVMSSNTDNDDAELFEEVQNTAEKAPSEKESSKLALNDSVDDNFVKKYKAKLNKQQNSLSEVESDKGNSAQDSIKEASVSEDTQVNLAVPPQSVANDEIENITNGNIIEKPLNKEQLSYNESLDYADNNIKYSKYVIYIDPENKDFIESLTVKERKNLINRILREQDNITVTKKRLILVQTMLKHIIIAVITLAISVPIVYWTINASLEASINNYRKSQTLFQTLYKEKGKIKSKSSY